MAIVAVVEKVLGRAAATGEFCGWRYRTMSSPLDIILEFAKQNGMPLDAANVISQVGSDNPRSAGNGKP